jgi:flagellar hook protein FlgE
MGLASSLTTSLTGLSAAETQIDVIGNNLANSQTVGFKSSKVIFADQFLQTLSLGSSPTESSGGTNPRQTGLGVQVAEITPNFRQGTIEISSSSSDLAIQGEGFFIVQGTQGEQLYTRNGLFKLNSENELVTATGQRLLGYGIDELFRVQQTQLTALQVPVGSEMVARATSNVNFEGALTPEGDIANTAQVIQSAVLGDALVPQPDGTNVSIGGAPVTDAAGVTATAAGGGTLAAGVYQYRLAYTDSNGNESSPSQVVSATVGANGEITLGNLPTSGSLLYAGINVYRTAADGADFFFLGAATPGGSFVDNGSTPLSTQPLDAGNLTGNYSYMFTFHKTGEQESRPSFLLGPQNIVSSRVSLSGFPTPPAPPAGGGFPAYDRVRIYRNLSSDQNNFYLVDTIAPGDVFTDNRSDAEISDLTDTSNKLLDLDGPRLDGNTLLTNVLKREGFSYVNVFDEGTLTYQGLKGGRALGDREFSITSSSTVQDLIDFIEDASGIQTSQVDAANPIPTSENSIAGETGTLNPGGYVNNGALRFVSNNGTLNALDIDLTAFRLELASGEIQIPNLAFGTIQEATGTSAVSDFIVYDSLGVPINVRVTAVLEERTDDQTVYRWFADSPENQPRSGSEIAVGTGLIRFDGNGNFVSVTNSQVNLNRHGFPSVTPLQFDLDFTTVSGLATPTASLAATRQDGSAPGVLTSFVVGEDGVVRGVFSNGITRDLGQIRLARFANPEGLDRRGQNLWAQGINTGLPIEGAPGENGIGVIKGGAVELSNTDIGKDLIDLVLASTMYRGNSRVITTSQQLLDELLNLRR